jgi:MFS family permease
MNVVGIFGLIYFPRPNDMSSLPLFIVAFMWVEFWNNVATAPFSALIPDIVPPDQRGSASGWYGLMSMLGNFAGGLSALIFTRNGETDLVAIYYFIAAALVFGMLGTVLFVKEPEVTRKLPPFQWGEFLRGLIEPLRDHDFRWVFWTRFLMVMGTFTVQEFLQFFMRDVVKDFSLFGKTVAQNAESAVSFFIIGLLFGAILSSLAAGVLSDRFGRKFMVYISSALQAIVPIVFIFYSPFGLVVSLGLVFGLGYGAYQAVDWALASDVLPSQDDYAKDMGVWHVAFTFPQVIATPIAGFMLDKFQVVGAQSGAPNLGYTAIFSLATLYFILGTVLVRQIRKVR